MVPITVGCLCPPDGARHPDGDTVNLHDPLPFKQALAMEKAVGIMVNDADEPPEAEMILAELTEAYVFYGIESWSVLDEKGDPLPVTRSNITARLLTDFAAAHTVADAADGLYSRVVMRPLLERAWKSSQPTPTDDSTSAPTASPTEPPKPSRRSSTTTSQTDDTEPTSPSLDGDYNSSPKLVSVG